LRDLINPFGHHQYLNNYEEGLGLRKHVSVHPCRICLL
jgi:hypothetical protein